MHPAFKMPGICTRLAALTAANLLTDGGCFCSAPLQGRQHALHNTFTANPTPTILPRPHRALVAIMPLQVPGHLAAALQFRGHVRGTATVEAWAATLREIMAVSVLALHFLRGCDWRRQPHMRVTCGTVAWPEHV